MQTTGKLLNLLDRAGLGVARCTCMCMYSSDSSSANSGTSQKQPTNNADYEINPQFMNRNPRNLEFLGLAYKRIGWDLQFPRKDYYHKLKFSVTNRHTTGRIEHCTGKTVASASTAEWALRENLYSCTDVAAAENIGRVLAQRCLQFGLTNVFYDKLAEHDHSDTMQAFLLALQDGQVTLKEPEEIEPEYVPGIDYDRPNRYAEKREWIDTIQV